jgi:peroxiredoxin
MKYLSNSMNMILIIFLCLLFSTSIFADKELDRLAVLGSQLKDFKLPILGGGEFQLSKFKGKNVMLVFPRGYYDYDYWCDICAYQYADLVDEQQKQDLMKKYNIEIVFILPYREWTVKKWLDEIPVTLAWHDDWRDKDYETASKEWKEWIDYCRVHYPKKFNWVKGKTPAPFKVLVDAKQEFSKRLDIFRMKWGGTEIHQNIPTTIILDKNHRVIFKHRSQYTLDRPSIKYLIKFMDAFLK